MQRRRGLAAVMIIGVLLSGCTPVAEETPPPTVVTPTGTTPQWTEDEQAAIDAVQMYLQVWTEISQDLEGQDWNRIRDVSSDPAANNALFMWSDWADEDLHLVGEPVFTVDWVKPGMQDYQGVRFHVHGCYSIEDGYLSDPQGNPVDNRGTERTPGEYLVIFLTNERHLVLEENVMEGSC